MRVKRLFSVRNSDPFRELDAGDEGSCLHMVDGLSSRWARLHPTTLMIVSGMAQLPVIGWREYLALPELGVGRIKVKVDTGARTSALHATRLKVYRAEDGSERVRFVVPAQGERKTRIDVDVPVLEWRRVKSSNGRVERRPVIVTPVELFKRRWSIELTLTRRDGMNFPMLLGRQALRTHVLVDVSKSFLASPKPKGKL